MMTRTWKSVATSLLAVCMTGCGADDIIRPLASDATTLYWKLEVNHPAVMLSVHAPYDTVQLAALAKNAYGDVLSHDEPVQFRKVAATDTSVQVAPNGLVTAKHPTTGAVVEVSLTIDGILHVDTTTIMVRSENPVRLIGSINFQPVPPDSSWLWAGATILTPTQFNRWLKVYDANGTQVSNSQAAVNFAWDDNSIVSEEYPSARAVLGETYIKARTYAYGRSVSDSVLFRRIDPTLKYITISRVVPVNAPPTVAFFPKELTVRSGTTILFMNRIDVSGTMSIGTNVLRSLSFTSSRLDWVDSVDVVFDDSTLVVAANSYGRIPHIPALGFLTLPSDGKTGNISAFGFTQCARTSTTVASDRCGGRTTSTASNVILDQGWRTRRFVTPGTYRYSSTRVPGAQGTIVVTP